MLEIVNAIYPFIVDNFGYFTTAGGGVAWYITQKSKQKQMEKMEAEIIKIEEEKEKLKLEYAEKEMFLNQELDKYSDEYANYGIDVQQNIEICFNAIKSDNVEDLRKYRKELCDLFLNHYIPSLIRLIKYYRIVFKNDKNERLIFIKEEVDPFLLLKEYFLSVVNHENVLANLGIPPLNISDASLNPIHRFIEESKSTDSD